MSAAVIPFKGEWQGRAEPKQNRADLKAIGDARLILAAKSQNDDWTARLLLAMLETLTSKQRELLEFRLMGPQLDSQSAVQALAIVQLATGDKNHRDRVRGYLTALSPREAE